MNPWYDKVNHERELTILGNFFGQVGKTQNTVFCLFEPDAPGLTADSFPTEDSIYFGTRPGRRYPFVTRALSAAELAMMVTKRRTADSDGRANMDADVIERIVWEYQNARDGYGIAKVMRELSAKHPGKPDASPEDRLLPVMPDLQQTLNMASADSRGVIVAVLSEGDPEGVEQKLIPLVFEQGIAGRSHIARLQVADWAQAKASGLIQGSTQEQGVFFVAPDPFGLGGEAWAEIEPGASQQQLRESLAAALDRFHKTWRKLDRQGHLAHGSENKIGWTEYDPDAGCVVKLPIVEEGSD